MMTKNATYLICLAMPLVANTALAEQAASIKPLLMRALNQDQPIKVELTGKPAEEIRQKTKAAFSTKVFAEVATVKEFTPDCKRLKLTFSEPGHLMATKNGTSEPFVMWYELNLCRNGQPPHPSLTDAGRGR